MYLYFNGVIRVKEYDMKRDLIRGLHADMEAYADREVTLGGWVRSVRTGSP